MGPVSNVLVSPEPEALVPPGLDPLVKRLFVGIALSALGSGLTMPFLFVYLAEVRGIPTATVGLLFAFMGLLGFIGSPLGGTLIDRVGPRPVMIVGLVTEAIGVGSLALVHNAWHAMAVATFITLGTVKTHLANIQAKLDVSNRVGIAAWAWSSGLLAGFRAGD